MLLSGVRRLTFGKSLDKLLSYSEPGGFSTYSIRQRFPIYNKAHTDPVVTDYFFARFVHDWCYDVPSYNYWFQMALGFTLALMSVSRHLLFNPDIYCRRQEAKKPFPDRHRQYQYASPFYNHQLRNYATRYGWCWIDNDWDVHEKPHPAGAHPTREHATYRHWSIPGCHTTTAPRYQEEDELLSSTSTKNFARIYRQLGYSEH